MLLVLFLGFSFFIGVISSQANDQIKVDGLYNMLINPGNIKLTMPDIELGVVNGPGAGSGVPSMLSVSCLNTPTSITNTVVGGILGFQANSINKTLGLAAMDLEQSRLSNELQKSQLILGVCDDNSEVCPIVAALDPMGDQYAAMVVAGGNPYMSPFGTSSMPLQTEAYIRDMAYTNPFLFGGGYNYTPYPPTGDPSTALGNTRGTI